jgi:hypothetical protein
LSRPAIPVGGRGGGGERVGGARLLQRTRAPRLPPSPSPHPLPRPRSPHPNLSTTRSIGLLPLFNEASGYLKHKISSSVLASLATSTPLIVPEEFLGTYTYIKKEHVLLMVGGYWGFGAG